MLSRIRSFISRHRRKFFGVAVTGAVIWGGWSYFNWRMRRSEEDYVREVLNRAKRYMHHKSSAEAAEKQTIALMPVATKATSISLDTNAIVCELKGRWTDKPTASSKDSSIQQSKGAAKELVPLTPEERIAKWDELKRVTFAWAVAYAYVPSILIVFLRLQLGLLGGYVFRSCGGDNIDSFLNGGEERQSKEEKQESMPVEIQEAYLSLSQYFLEGKPSVMVQLHGSIFKESEENLISGSCWAEHNGGLNITSGRSKLNLKVSSDYCQAVNGNHSTNSLQKKLNGDSPSVKLPMELVECRSKGDLIKQDNSGSDDTSTTHDKKCMPNAVDYSSEKSAKHEKGINDDSLHIDSPTDKPGENQVVSSAVFEEKQIIKEGCASISVESKKQCVDTTDKGELLPNGIPDRCDFSNSGSQGCELTNCVAVDETRDQKNSSAREVVEEDSGRCSGIDDTSEEEIVDENHRKSGIAMLCSLLELKVGRVVDGTSLKAPLSLGDTETLFWGVLTSIRSNPAEDPVFNLPKYLLPSPEVLKGMADDLEARLDRKASLLFLEMVSETADLLETKEVVELIQSCVSAGLGHIMDKLSNYFPQETLSFTKPAMLLHPGTTEKQIQGKPQQHTIPMAKLIPLINKVAFEDGYPWVRVLLEMSNLKDFGANVYEAFTH